MNYHDIAKRLREGTININFQGHCGVRTSQETLDHMVMYITERLLERYDHDLSFSLGAHDNKWTNSANQDMEKVNADMREHYSRGLTKQCGLDRWAFFDDMQCEFCGSKLFFYGHNDEILISDTYKDYRDSSDTYPQIRECKLPIMTPINGKIKISSDMVIANFFSDLPNDAPDLKRWSTEYCINSYLGRVNTAKWKVEHQNVAYGQMGNMSLDVRMNPEKTHVILVSSYYDDYADEVPNSKEILEKYKDYTNEGHISLCVWRWEATDLATLGVERENVKTLVEEYKKEYQDIVVLPVKTGTWEFTHYYDMPNVEHGDDTYLYAELKLVED